MNRLHEETNQKVCVMFPKQELSLDVLKATGRAVTTKQALQDLSLRCHAAIVQTILEADPILNIEGTEYYIDISRGGATIAIAPHTPAIRTFQQRRVISMPLRIASVEDSSSTYINLFDLIDGQVQIGETEDDSLINTLLEIIECYRDAFERVNFGDAAARVRRGAARHARVNAEIDDALANANINEEDTYWIIGWLAKNITSIKAEIPNTPAARRSLETEYPILQEVPDTDISAYYGVNRGSSKNRWDKSTQITISKKTEMPPSVREFLETISLHRSTVDDNGLSSNVAAIKLREFGFTLGPNDPNRIKDFCYNILKDRPTEWENFLAGFNGIRKQDTPAFNPEVEAEVNPLNQEFPD